MSVCAAYSIGEVTGSDVSGVLHPPRHGDKGYRGHNYPNRFKV
jgi:hypothetical protein